MAVVEIDRITKSFGSRTILGELKIVIGAGQVLALRGDNGCGKTTLLNIIAGIENASSGDVRFHDVEGDLRIGYAQQNYSSSLLPWFDSLDNVSLPLRIRGVEVSERRRRASDLLEELSYSIVPHRAYPHQLSGGQKQRLAIARSLIMRPQLLILDEPFASLDPHASREIQESLARFHASERPTICFVSHDLDHCLYLADRIILLHGSPTKVVSEFYVSTPRPRSRTAILEPASLALRAAILSEEEKLYATRRR